MEDGGLETGEVMNDSEEVGESVADVEGAREGEVDSEREHLLEEAPLGLFIEGGIMIIETDFADGNQARRF